MDKSTIDNPQSALPPVKLALIPVVMLMSLLIAVIIIKGASSVADLGPVVLLVAAACAVIVARIGGTLNFSKLGHGISASVRTLAPALPLLVCIAFVSATWMYGGIVPTLICYGIDLINPEIFLFLTCAVCSAVSVLLGSSWTTVATVGVAFAGIGHVLGYSDGWIAGAVISGAYFGDKVSPLSDTTVVASSSCGVDLFTHIRYLMITAVPAMTIALIIFFIAGLGVDNHPISHSTEIAQGLRSTFNITPWLLTVPAITGLLCAFRVKSSWVMLISAGMGIVAIFVSQPHIFNLIATDADAICDKLLATTKLLFTETAPSTGNDMLDDLISTGGVAGMMPTIILISCAMVFGGTLIGTGMLASLTNALTRVLAGSKAIVSATVGSGLMLNAATGDQYLSLIIGSNLYGRLYRQAGLEDKLLSRTLEDSISVTSPLIPWNSCGLTQSAVLGIATLTYLPYCFFNYLTPVMSIIVVASGYRIRRGLTAR